MTAQQEAALKLIFDRAGEHRGSAHVDTTGINRHLLVNLILAGYLTINADNTVTFTSAGIAMAVRLRRMLAERGGKLTVNTPGRWLELPAFFLPWR